MKILDPCDVFYDIGSNIGSFACLAGQHVRDNHLVAIEPYPPNVEILERNMERNNIQDKIIQAAISNKTGSNQLVIGLSRSGTGVNALKSSDDQIKEYAERYGDHERMTVSTPTLDDLISEYNLLLPTIVKIDAEGAEFKVLKRMEKTLGNINYVFIEVHEDIDHYGDGTEDIFTSLL